MRCGAVWCGARAAHNVAMGGRVGVVGAGSGLASALALRQSARRCMAVTLHGGNRVVRQCGIAGRMWVSAQPQAMVVLRTRPVPRPTPPHSRLGPSSPEQTPWLRCCCCLSARPSRPLHLLPHPASLPNPSHYHPTHYSPPTRPPPPRAAPAPLRPTNRGFYHRNKRFRTPHEQRAREAARAVAHPRMPQAPAAAPAAAAVASAGSSMCDAARAARGGSAGGRDGPPLVSLAQLRAADEAADAARNLRERLRAGLQVRPDGWGRSVCAP